MSNRWLTLQDSLGRVLEQFTALQSFFAEKSHVVRQPDTQTQHNRLAAAFASKTLYAKVLFLRIAAELFLGFSVCFKGRSHFYMSFIMRSLHWCDEF